ncbi:MBL fold metallo-hydrolase [Candidatus Berkiella aquae]|uniref:MBL fold metallo-hydrolase n=1 Tax=Candidatus Berkiella aquae TaxID=295108 RepID=A0A0Q9YZG4_9GAMM|nr:MBL fold metallo-hydrolase [Candidatus Berkiella aquae]MCS5711532.1 MBL fold metallo-hydrolase [Candidatus Berkiella aquae]
MKPSNDHFDGKHFYNFWQNKITSKGWLDFWKWKFFQQQSKWPTQVENTETPALPLSILPDEFYITFINHSTELIQTYGLNILTDPLFSLRTSPVSWLGPKRVRAPGLALKDLPKIDIVIISHNHYDHMDLVSLKALTEKDNPLFIVPLQNAYILNKKGITNIIELDWWQTHYINENRSITAVPAQHWSKRTLFDTNKSLWCSFIINIDETQIFFAGDTGFSEHFKLIKQRMGKMDICLLPIGSYEPRWFMKANHLNPEEAVKAHIDLGSTLSIGMHYGTFQLSDESYDDPINHLQLALQQLQINKNHFLTPTNGKTIYFNKNPKST